MNFFRTLFSLGQLSKALPPLQIFLAARSMRSLENAGKIVKNEEFFLNDFFVYFGRLANS